MANFVKLYVEEITDAEDHIQGGSRDEDVLRCTETVRIGKGLIEFPSSFVELKHLEFLVEFWFPFLHISMF